MRKISILLFLYLVSCSQVPMTGRKQLVAIPSSQMIALSAASYSRVLEESQLSSNTEYVNRVRDVGERVTGAVESYLKENRLESAMAGYDPRIAPDFWKRMDTRSGARPPEFLSTHPDPANRVEKLNQLMPKALEYYNPDRRP